MTPDDVPDRPLVIDTDVASWIRAGHAKAAPFKPLIRGHLLCLSFASVGELWAGAEKAGWAAARRDGLASFIRSHVTLPSDDDVTQQWGQIHALFRDQVDVNDEWIAACALSQTPVLPIVTGNVKHFRPIAQRFTDLTVVHPDL